MSRSADDGEIEPIELQNTLSSLQPRTIIISEDDKIVDNTPKMESDASPEVVHSRTDDLPDGGALPPPHFLLKVFVDDMREPVTTCAAALPSFIALVRHLQQRVLPLRYTHSELQVESRNVVRGDSDREAAADGESPSAPPRLRNPLDDPTSFAAPNAAPAQQRIISQLFYWDVAEKRHLLLRSVQPLVENGYQGTVYVQTALQPRPISPPRVVDVGSPLYGERRHYSPARGVSSSPQQSPARRGSSVLGGGRFLATDDEEDMHHRYEDLASRISPLRETTPTRALSSFALPPTPRVPAQFPRQGPESSFVHAASFMSGPSPRALSEHGRHSISALGTVSDLSTPTNAGRRSSLLSSARRRSLNFGMSATRPDRSSLLATSHLMFQRPSGVAPVVTHADMLKNLRFSVLCDPSLCHGHRSGGGGEPGVLSNTSAFPAVSLIHGQHSLHAHRKPPGGTRADDLSAALGVLERDALRGYIAQFEKTVNSFLSEPALDAAPVSIQLISAARINSAEMDQLVESEILKRDPAGSRESFHHRMGIDHRSPNGDHEEVDGAGGACAYDDPRVMVLSGAGLPNGPGFPFFQDGGLLLLPPDVALPEICQIVNGRSDPISDEGRATTSAGAADGKDVTARICSLLVDVAMGGAVERESPQPSLQVYSLSSRAAALPLHRFRLAKRNELLGAILPESDQMSASGDGKGTKAGTAKGKRGTSPGGEVDDAPPPSSLRTEALTALILAPVVVHQLVRHPETFEHVQDRVTRSIFAMPSFLMALCQVYLPRDTTSPSTRPSAAQVPHRHPRRKSILRIAGTGTATGFFDRVEHHLLACRKEELAHLEHFGVESLHPSVVSWDELCHGPFAIEDAASGALVVSLQNPSPPQQEDDAGGDVVNHHRSGARCMRPILRPSFLAQCSVEAASRDIAAHLAFRAHFATNTSIAHASGTSALKNAPPRPPLSSTGSKGSALDDILLSKEGHHYCRRHPHARLLSWCSSCGTLCCEECVALDHPETVPTLAVGQPSSPTIAFGGDAFGESDQRTQNEGSMSDPPAMQDSSFGGFSLLKLTRRDNLQSLRNVLFPLEWRALSRHVHVSSHCDEARASDDETAQSQATILFGDSSEFGVNNDSSLTMRELQPISSSQQNSLSVGREATSSYNHYTMPVGTATRRVVDSILVGINLSRMHIIKVFRKESNELSGTPTSDISESTFRDLLKAQLVALGASNALQRALDDAAYLLRDVPDLLLLTVDDIAMELQITIPPAAHEQHPYLDPSADATHLRVIKELPQKYRKAHLLALEQHANNFLMDEFSDIKPADRAWLQDTSLITIAESRIVLLEAAEKALRETMVTNSKAIAKTYATEAVLCEHATATRVWQHDAKDDYHVAKHHNAAEPAESSSEKMSTLHARYDAAISGLDNHKRYSKADTADPTEDSSTSDNVFQKKSAIDRETYRSQYELSKGLADVSAAMVAAQSGVLSHWRSLLVQAQKRLQVEGVVPLQCARVRIGQLLHAISHHTIQVVIYEHLLFSSSSATLLLSSVEGSVAGDINKQLHICSARLLALVSQLSAELNTAKNALLVCEKRFGSRVLIHNHLVSGKDLQQWAPQETTRIVDPHPPTGSKKQPLPQSTANRGPRKSVHILAGNVPQQTSFGASHGGQRPSLAPALPRVHSAFGFPDILSPPLEVPTRIHGLRVVAQCLTSAIRLRHRPITKIRSISGCGIEGGTAAPLSRLLAVDSGRSLPSQDEEASSDTTSCSDDDGDVGSVAFPTIDFSKAKLIAAADRDELFKKSSRLDDVMRGYVWIVPDPVVIFNNLRTNMNASSGGDAYRPRLQSGGPVATFAQSSGGGEAYPSILVPAGQPPSNMNVQAEPIPATTTTTTTTAAATAEGPVSAVAAEPSLRSRFLRLFQSSAPKPPPEHATNAAPALGGEQLPTSEVSAAPQPAAPSEQPPLSMPPPEWMMHPPASLATPPTPVMMVPPNMVMTPHAQAGGSGVMRRRQASIAPLHVDVIASVPPTPLLSPGLPGMPAGHVQQPSLHAPSPSIGGGPHDRLSRTTGGLGVRSNILPSRRRSTAMSHHIIAPTPTNSGTSSGGGRPRQLSQPLPLTPQQLHRRSVSWGAAPAPSMPSARNSPNVNVPLMMMHGQPHFSGGPANTFADPRNMPSSGLRGPQSADTALQSPPAGGQKPHIYSDIFVLGGLRWEARIVLRTSPPVPATGVPPSSEAVPVPIHVAVYLKPVDHMMRIDFKVVLFGSQAAPTDGGWAHAGTAIGSVSPRSPALGIGHTRTRSTASSVGVGAPASTTLSTRHQTTRSHNSSSAGRRSVFSGQQDNAGPSDFWYEHVVTQWPETRVGKPWGVDPLANLDSILEKYTDHGNVLKLCFVALGDPY